MQPHVIQWQNAFGQLCFVSGESICSRIVFAFLGCGLCTECTKFHVNGNIYSFPAQGEKSIWRHCTQYDRHCSGQRRRVSQPG